MNVIGLGNAGCQIAKNFENYGQYRVFYVDHENKGYDNFLPVKKQNSHEDYEKNYRKLDLSSCTGPTTVVLSGAGKISGCILRLLEQLKKNQITILYIKPAETQFMSETGLRTRVTLGVLQEYTRSALIDKIYIVSNDRVEQILEELSLKNYWKDINNIISSTYHMLEVFENTEPLLTTFTPETQNSRIATFGVVNYETGEERLFYNLQHPRIKKYFYGISEKSMGDDKDLLHKIRKFVDSQAGEKTNSGFSIYTTEYDKNYVYTKHYASFVQEQNIK